MKFAALIAMLASAPTVFAQRAQFCPLQNNVCYSINIPELTASSGNGDIFFQIQGPSTQQWIGIGQGSQMAGSNIFVIYTDSSGINLTLSPRVGEGHVQPLFNSNAQVFLLEGSGVINGNMTANVRCSNCASWSGGTMDFTSSKSSWIWAAKTGSSLMDDSQTADLDQHTGYGTFVFDLAEARGGNSLNPFVDAAVATTTASTAVPAASNVASNEAGPFSNGNPQSTYRAQIAHGTIMGFAFVVIFPLGAILMRLCSFKSLVWIHAGIQLYGYVLALIGLALGVFIATVPTPQLDSYHPIIGMVVIALLLFQPLLGLSHHRIYRTSRRPTIWSTAHVWLGRVTVTLGIINGGLGLRLTDNTVKGEIAYGVIAGLVWLTWMSVTVIRPSTKTTSRR